MELGGYQYGVIPQSNDDLGRKRYIRQYHERITALEAEKAKTDFLLSAFCPTLEENNNSLGIIDEIYSNDLIFMVPIVYKWCGHAKLEIEKMKRTYSGRVRTFHPVTAQESGERVRQFCLNLTTVGIAAQLIRENKDLNLLTAVFPDVTIL